MDIFIEQLVKKKKGAKEAVLVVGAIVLGLILIFLSLQLFAVPFLGTFVLLIVAAIIFGIYMLVTSINLEYEYIMTNGELDVDKIINVRKRKRMVSVNAREIEMLAPSSDHAFHGVMMNKEIKKIYACDSVESDNLYFVLFKNGETKTALLFNPNEKVLNGFKQFNPRSVTIAQS